MSSTTHASKPSQSTTNLTNPTDSTAQTQTTSTISTSSSSLPSKPPLSISPYATVSDKALLMGTHLITISTTCVIHPFSRLDSSHGPIFLSDSVVVWERATVGGGMGKSHVGGRESGDDGKSAAPGNAKGIFIAEHVSIGPHAVVGPACQIGAYTVLGVHSVVFPGAEVGTHVTLAPCVQIQAGEHVEDYTSVFMLGDRIMKRRTFMSKAVTPKEEGDADADALRWRELREKGHEKEVGMLRRVVKGGGKWISGD